VDAGGTPRVAMFLSAAAALLMILTGTFELLVAVAAFLFITVDAAGFLALIALRRHEPDLPRPYRARGYPWTPALLLCGCAFFLGGNIMSDTKSSLYTLTLIAISYPAYLAVRRRASRRSTT
jgi:APA family basic amino acid/polyamine antiporter